MPNSKKTLKDWRELAASATKETDPEKLIEIIEELCGALDQREQLRKGKPNPDL